MTAEAATEHVIAEITRLETELKQVEHELSKAKIARARAREEAAQAQSALAEQELKLELTRQRLFVRDYPAGKRDELEEELRIEKLQLHLCRQEHRQKYAESVALHTIVVEHNQRRKAIQSERILLIGEQLPEGVSMPNNSVGLPPVAVELRNQLLRTKASATDVHNKWMAIREAATAVVEAFDINCKLPAAIDKLRRFADWNHPVTRERGLALTQKGKETS